MIEEEKLSNNQLIDIFFHEPMVGKGTYNLLQERNLFVAKSSEYAEKEVDTNNVTGYSYYTLDKHNLNSYFNNSEDDAGKTCYSINSCGNDVEISMYKMDADHRYHCIDGPAVRRTRTKELRHEKRLRETLGIVSLFEFIIKREEAYAYIHGMPITEECIVKYLDNLGIHFPWTINNPIPEEKVEELYMFLTLRHA